MTLSVVVVGVGVGTGPVKMDVILGGYFHSVGDKVVFDTGENLEG